MIIILMATLALPEIPADAGGSLETLIAYAGTTARDHEPNGKRIERVGDSAIPTFISNLEQLAWCKNGCFQVTLARQIRPS